MIDYIGVRGKTVGSAPAYVDGQGCVFLLCFDSDHDAGSAYGINAKTFSVFINEDFELYAHLKVMTDLETLERYIEQIK